jgi:hypothetical protein
VTTSADTAARSAVPSSEYAPIAIFAFKRPLHTSRLVDSLLRNPILKRSPLFVFCDGARDPTDEAAVAQTRAIVRERLGSYGEIFESATNKGLAQSIIAGVTGLCDRYGRVIVLEDDLELHSSCLTFLNEALRHYANEPKVYHVNAYRYPLPPAAAPHFSRLTSSWGWATWQRAWAHFEPDAVSLEQRVRASRLIRALEFGGTFPYYRMLRYQARQKIDSWAIRWYATVLLRGGLAVCPNVSQVGNHGFDGSGVHCGSTSSYEVDLGAASLQWPSEVSEDILNYKQMQAFFRSVRDSFPRRVLRKLKRTLLPR